MSELKICKHGIIEKCCAACAESEPQVRSSAWLADINESETKAWDNMRVKEDQLQRATEELREATRSWSMQYSKLREAMKQQMSANAAMSDPDTDA